MTEVMKEKREINCKFERLGGLADEPERWLAHFFCGEFSGFESEFTMTYVVEDGKILELINHAIKSIGNYSPEERFKVKQYIKECTEKSNEGLHRKSGR